MLSKYVAFLIGIFRQKIKWMCEHLSEENQLTRRKPEKNETFYANKSLLKLMLPLYALDCFNWKGRQPLNSNEKKMRKKKNANEL